jgi:hypothetical protein
MLALAFGCADLFGLGDYTQGNPGDSGLDVFFDVILTNEAGGCIATCVPTVPSGWAAVGYDQGFQGNCAFAYGTPTDVSEGITAGAATCGCGCNPTAPTCSSLQVTSGDGGSNTCNNQSSQTVAWGGSCATITTSINIQNVKISATPGGSGTCAPDASVVMPNVDYAHQGRVCELLAKPAGGCEAGICVPDPSPFLPCVYQIGVVACPSEYPVQHIVGSKLNDTRGCSPCTCGTQGGACAGTVTFSNGANCNSGGQTINADGTCQTVTNQVFKSLFYSPTSTNPTCTPSAVTAIGDAGYGDPQTVCCLQ